MAGNIWVYVDHLKGQVTDATYEALALGRELAGALGVQLEAVVAGAAHRGLLINIGAADRALVTAGPEGELPGIETLAGHLAPPLKEREPRALLFPLSNMTMGLATLLAARLGLPSVNFATGARAREDRIEVDCLLYGGKIQAVVTPLGGTVIVGLWPGSRSAEGGHVAKPPAEVEDLPPAAPAPSPVKLLRLIEPVPGGVNLTEQAVLVSVGRGIQNKENVELAEELAQTLGGAVCGSRPVIDQAWLPLSRQVGKSGVTVKSKLYLAAGISGAPEHLEGMRGCQLIVAVNTDPRAPIFQVAHYGVVADCLDLLPALTVAAKAKREHLCRTQ